MSLAERIPSHFRWEFIPSKDPADGGILWRWKTVTHSGDFVMQSNGSFYTFAECVEAAVRARNKEPSDPDH